MSYEETLWASVVFPFFPQVTDILWENPKELCPEGWMVDKAQNIECSFKSKHGFDLLLPAKQQT